jgi:hypothetical protein
MNPVLQDFITANTRTQWVQPAITPHDLVNSDWPWAPHRPANFDAAIIEAEMAAIDHLFVEHRARDKIHSYGHDGWWSITLHGTQPDHTEHWDRYGFKSLEEANYQWTSVNDMIPTTSKLIRSLPFRNWGRVRIMRLAPGGYIMPHSDGPGRIWGPYNLALTNPPGCQFVFEDRGVVPFEPGLGFILDIGRQHALYNNSDQPRYHAIVHGQYTIPQHQLVEAAQ